MTRTATTLRLSLLGIAGLLSVATSQVEPTVFESREGPPLVVNDAFPTLDTHVTATVSSATSSPIEITFADFQVSGALTWVPEEPGTGGTQVTVRVVPDDPIEERSLFVEEGAGEQFTAIIAPMTFSDNGTSGATFEVELGDGPIGELDIDWEVSLLVELADQETADASAIDLAFDDFD